MVGRKHPRTSIIRHRSRKVEINRNSIESSLAHRYGQKKLDAITSLVEGFENAVYIGTMPDSRERGVVDHYFAYPIIYNGELNYVFCRAMQDANKNRLYVHEVFVADKIKKGNTLQTAASKPHGGISLYRDILANVLSVDEEVYPTTSTPKGTELVSNNQENKEENTEKVEEKQSITEETTEEIQTESLGEDNTTEETRQRVTEEEQPQVAPMQLTESDQRAIRAEATRIEKGIRKMARELRKEWKGKDIYILEDMTDVFQRKFRQQIKENGLIGAIALNAKEEETAKQTLKRMLSPKFRGIFDGMNGEEIITSFSSHGFFKDSTGKVYVNMSANLNAEDLKVTLFHEAVAHKGLRELLGKDNFNRLCQAVAEAMPTEIKERLTKAYSESGSTITDALIADEYMASLAEQMAENNGELTIPQRIVGAMRNFFRNLFNLKLNEADIKYLLYASYKKLKGDEDIQTSINNSATLKRLRDIAVTQQADDAVRNRLVYHGSGAEFERFDHNYMGTGEGAQAYGWGTYVTDVEGIGRTYATTMRDNLISEKHKENAIINKLAKETLESNNGDKEEALNYLRSLLDEDWSDKKRVKAQIKIIETGRFLPETKVKAHLYNVDIPDDNGTNYIHWETNTQELADKLNDAYRTMLIKEKGVKEEDINPDFAPFGKGVSGGTIYNLFARELRGDKQASQFLNSLGFVGISYPAQATTGGRADGARNFVIFNEDDAQIVEHTRFRMTEEDKNNIVDINEQEGQVRFSLSTYNESGRETLAKYLDSRVLDGALTAKDAEDIKQQLETIYNLCTQYTDDYEPFGNWSEAKVVRDERGNPVFSVIKTNGDYDMNLDFSLVCKKRRTLDAVFDEMISRGIIKAHVLGQVDIARINDIIRQYGFETACRLCFVDSKRFRVAQVADEFCDIWNELVDMTDAQLEEVIETEEKESVRKKSAKLLLSSPENRIKLSRANFMSAKGFDDMKANHEDILKLYNAKKGTGGPKASSADVQYLNDILNTNWTPESAYAVGGVRIQSFSDFVPRMVFDYIQMMADLSAKGLPAHAYTKEPLFAKIFGLTGVKINLSLVPRVAEDGVAPGLDAEGNYVWQEGETYPYEEAITLQNTEGYKDNVGTIAVGISDEHIEKLLNDPNIRMVIPYHKSALNPIVAQFNKIDQFTDYTNEQNTLKADGTKLGKDVEVPNFNQMMHDGMTPQEAAQAYLDWCDANGYTPKFSMFRNNPNYYKLLEDFTCSVDGKYMPQHAVTMSYPSNLEELIKQGLEEDAVLEGKRNAELSNIVDSIEEAFAVADEIGGLTEEQFRKQNDITKGALPYLTKSGIVTVTYGNNGIYYNWSQPEYADIYKADKKQIKAEIKKVADATKQTIARRKILTLQNTEKAKGNFKQALETEKQVKASVKESVDKQFFNEGVRFSLGDKKTTPETESVQDEHQQTVISSADGAKIIENLDNAIDTYIKQFSGAKDLDIVVFNTTEDLYNFALENGYDDEGARKVVKEYTTNKNAGGYVPGTNMVLLFGFKDNNTYSTLLHEHIHYAIENMGGIDKFLTLSQELANFDEVIVKFVNRNYKKDIDEEIITFSMEIAYIVNAIENLRNKLSADAQLQLNEILNKTGYNKDINYGKEIERFTTEANRRVYEDYSEHGRKQYNLASTHLRDNIQRRGQGILEQDAHQEAGVNFRLVEDPELIEKLESEPTIKVYRAMQLVDGKLYPPMSAKVDGKWRTPSPIGVWEEAEENPELADNKGYFKLDKGNKTSLKARYNPYFHTSRTPLNDQFSSAQDRPELVTVEVEVPLSELTSGYKAEKAKDAVGELEWKAGVVQGKLSGTRKVILSRWSKPIRIVPDSEVAQRIVEMFGDKQITMPSNVVTPSLRSELEKLGVPFVETDNQGKPIETRFRLSEETDNILTSIEQRNAEAYNSVMNVELPKAETPIEIARNKKVEVMFRRFTPDQDFAVNNPATMFAAANAMGFWDKQVENYWDSFITLKKYEDAIEKAYGVNLAQLGMSAYIGENTSQSRAQTRSAEFNQTYEKKLADTLKPLYKEIGEQQMKWYAIARTGLERQAIKEAEARAKAQAEGKQYHRMDYAGLTGLLIEMMVSKGLIDNKQADTLKEWSLTKVEQFAEKKGVILSDYIQEIENKMGEETTSNLWSIVREIADEKLKLQLESGLLSTRGYILLMHGVDIKPILELNQNYGYDKKLINSANLRGMTPEELLKNGIIEQHQYDIIINGTPTYQYYLPLKGNTELTAEDLVNYEQKTAKNMASIKEAKGHKNMANNPFVQLINDAYGSISAAEHNRWLRSLLRTAQQFPSDAIKVSTTMVVPMTQVLPDGTQQLVYRVATQDDIERGWAEAINNKMGIEELHITKAQYQEHTVLVRDGGQVYTLEIQNHALAEAINTLGGRMKDKNGWIAKSYDTLNRIYASLKTSLNPAFVLPNMARDYGEALTNNSIIFGTKAIAPFSRAVEPASELSRGLHEYLHLRARGKMGEFKADTPVKKLVKEFFDNGGETNYNMLSDYDTQRANLKQMMNLTQWDKTKNASSEAWKTYFGVYGNYVELMSRLATYAINRGTVDKYSMDGVQKSEQEAIFAAKEITTNFDKRGKNNKDLGRVIMFFNAGRQSNRNHWRLMKEHPLRYGLNALLMPFLAQLAMPHISAIVSMLLGDDDKDYNDYIDAYNTINKHIKSKNFVLMLGDHVLKVPVSPSFAPMLALGNAVNSVIFPHRNGADFGDFAVSMLDCWTSVASIGGVFSPVGEAIINRDYADAPIYREGERFKTLPSWHRAYDDTPELLINLNKFLNRISGGNSYTIGSETLDRLSNPGAIYHILTSWGGGYAEMANSLIRLCDFVSLPNEADALKRGGDVLKRTLIVNRFYAGNINDYIARDVEDAYWEIRELQATVRNGAKQSEIPVAYKKLNDAINSSPALDAYEAILKQSKRVDPSARAILKREIVERNPQLAKQILLEREQIENAIDQLEEKNLNYGN